jgi:TPR repeat protein
MSIRLSATLISLTLSTLVLAEPPVVAAPSATDLAVQQGLAFERKHEFGKAIELWKPLADRGNAVAQFSLGWMYEHGHGVAEDQAQAETWNRKAAEQGYPAAQYNVGVMYENGYGHPRDEEQAIAWYRKAAEQGYALAQWEVGEMSAQGRGIAKDEAQAIVWFRKAAAQGDVDAQVSLGMAYFLGRGVQENRGQAAHWFALAAQKGYGSAVSKLDIVVDTLPTLRMRATTNVRARPEANAPVVKSTAAGEVAYRLSEFDNWYEVYFRDHNIVGYVKISDASS